MTAHDDAGALRSVQRELVRSYRTRYYANMEFVATKSDACKSSGVVLAGGRSRRMGREKALLEVNGEPLWQRQMRVLREAGVAEVWLSARPEQTWAVTGGADGVVHDAIPDAGPLAGIVAALHAMRGTHLAVLAVDLPRMEPAWLRTLVGRCRLGFGGVGRRGGFFEPLAAIYPREILAAAEAALTSGERSLQRLLAAEAERFAVVEIGAEEAAWFENWNEPRV